MKTIGIIGGIGPESTIEYYRLLVTIYREQTGDGSYPPVIINSIDLQRMLGLIRSNRLADVAEYLFGEVSRLARAGADLGLLAANTPHIVFDELQRQSPIPLVSIVEATCAASKSLGLTVVGLFGTRFTMQGNFYPEVFARSGIRIVVPGSDDQDYLHERYLGELVQGIFLPETRKGLLAIVDQMRAADGIQALILGGTELPLILREASYHGLPLLDTARIHVERAVAQMISD